MAGKSRQKKVRANWHCDETVLRVVAPTVSYWKKFIIIIIIISGYLVQYLIVVKIHIIVFG